MDARTARPIEEDPPRPFPGGAAVRWVDRIMRKTAAVEWPRWQAECLSRESRQLAFQLPHGCGNAGEGGFTRDRGR